jgi:hypothetical protein
MSGTAVNQHFRVPCIVVALPFDIQYLEPMTARPHDIFILIVIIIGSCRLFPSPSTRSRSAPPSSLLKQNSNKRRRSSIDDGRSRMGEIIPTCHLPPPAVEIIRNIPHSDNMLSNHNPPSLILIDCHYFSTLIHTPLNCSMRHMS